MREIKFRTFQSGKMFYFPGPFVDLHASNLMQFTGLHDKNGKEIFEGDICRQCFGGKETVGSVQIESTRGAVLGGHTPIWPHDVEVIGNIYENPELLKP